MGGWRKAEWVSSANHGATLAHRLKRQGPGSSILHKPNFQLNPSAPYTTLNLQLSLTAATMRSSVSTATVPSKSPAPRGFTVKADGQQEPKFENEHDHFFWTYTEEPHRTRRMAIIKAHPEVFLPAGCIIGSPD